MLVLTDYIPDTIVTSVPPIFFDHVGYLDDELSFLILLTGFKGMFLYKIIKCEIRLCIISPCANKPKTSAPFLVL